MLGTMGLPGDPYDGQSLAAQIDQLSSFSGVEIKLAYVDRGYFATTGPSVRV